MSNLNNKPEHSKTSTPQKSSSKLSYIIPKFALNLEDNNNLKSINNIINSNPDLKHLIDINDAVARDKDSRGQPGINMAIRRLIFRIGMHALGNGLLANHDDMDHIHISDNNRHEFRHYVCKIYRANHELKLCTFYHSLAQQDALYFFHIFLDQLLLSFLAIAPPLNNPDFNHHYRMTKRLLNKSLTYQWHDSFSKPDDLYPWNPPPPPAPFPEKLVATQLWNVQ